MAPKMERPFMEGLLVRFLHSMAGKSEAQTEKNNKSVAKQEYKLWTAVQELSR